MMKICRSVHLLSPAQRQYIRAEVNFSKENTVLSGEFEKLHELQARDEAIHMLASTKHREVSMRN